MALLTLADIGGLLFFDEAQCTEMGAALHETYRDARPFPHIVLDDLLDHDLLRQAASQFPSSEGHSFYDDDQTRFKYQYLPREINSPLIRNLLHELTGGAFVAFLEGLTGIRGLITDSTFDGGGLHETKRGGKLAVHADFTMHKALKVERRINLLIYLNDDWKPEYGGHLELWSKSMRRPERSILPLLGRTVIFSTTRNSFHGQPDPVDCPPDRSRRSIAIYYYTAAESGLAAIPDRLTNFQVRPGSNDKRVGGLWREHLMRDWLPPRIYQAVRRKS